MSSEKNDRNPINCLFFSRVQCRACKNIRIYIKSMKKKQTSIKSLQQYDWTQTSIDRIIHYIRIKELPRDINTRQSNRFKEKFGEDFIIAKGKLIYQPLGLEVVPSNNEKAKQDVLNKVFNSPQAIGKGQNNFHQLVLQSYLGIKKDDVIKFLKTKPDMSLPFAMMKSSPNFSSNLLRWLRLKSFGSSFVLM